MKHNYFKKVNILFTCFLFFVFTKKINSQCAGSDNTVTICDKELDDTLQTYSLFDLLGPDAITGGTWVSNNPLNINTLDSNSGIVDLWSITRNGIHSFTYTNLDCQQSATITIELGGYAGENNIDKSANACADNIEGNSNNGNNTELFTFLNNDIDNLKVDVNGTWEGDAISSSNLTGSIFNAHEAGPGIYNFTYTVDAVSSCPSKTSNLILEVHTAPEPGIASNFIICDSDDLSLYQNLNLHDYLAGEDIDGFWVEEDGTSQLSESDNFDTFINVQEIEALHGAGDYQFTYFVNRDFGTCNNDFTTVTISIQKIAGDIPDVILCEEIEGFSIDYSGFSDSFSYDIEYEIHNTFTNQLIYSGTEQNIIAITDPVSNSVITLPSDNTITTPGSYNISVTNISNVSGIICDRLEITDGTYTLYDTEASIAQTCFEINDIAEVSITNHTDANGNLVNETQSLTYTIMYNQDETNIHTLNNDVTFINGNGTIPIDFNSLPTFGSGDLTLEFVTNNNTQGLSCIDFTFPIDFSPNKIQLNIDIDNACDATKVEARVEAPTIVGEYNITYEVTEINNTEILLSGNRIITGGLITDDLNITTLDEGNYQVTLRSIQNDDTLCRTEFEFELIEKFSIAGIPEPPTLSATSQSFCADEYLPNGPTIADITVATASTGNILMWYESATSADALDITEILENGDYFVAANDPNNECEDSARVSIQISIDTTSIPTSTDTNPTFCNIDNPTLNNLITTAENNGTIIWYDSATAGNILPETTNLIDNTNYYAAERNGTCESKARLEFSVTVITPPITLSSNTYCAAPGDTLAAIENLASTESGYELIWYDDLGNEIADNTTLLNQNTSYFVISKDTSATSACESEKNEITISITSNISSTDTNPFFCIEEDATIALLDASTTNGGTIVWYDSLTGGNELTISTDLENNTSYFASEQNGNCESNRTEFTPTILSAPIPINTIGNPICIITNESDIATIADLEAFVSTDNANGFELIWYDNFANGNILVNTTTLQEGQVYYVASIHPGSQCESELIAVTVAISSTVISTNKNPIFCGANTFTLADLEVTTVNGGALIWYASDDILDTTELPINTSLTTGVHTYYAAEKNGTCESNRLKFEVTILAPAIPVNLGTNPICITTENTIADIIGNFSTDTENTLVWYDASKTVIDITTVIEQNVSYYVASTFEDSGCFSELLEFTINKTAIPTTPNTTLNFCGVDNTTLADIIVTAPNGGDLIWYDSATNGNIITDNPILQTGNYYVSEKIGDCESERLAINVTIATPITPTNSGETIICTTLGNTISDIAPFITITSPYTLVWFDSENNTITTDTLLEQNAVYSVRSTFENTGCFSDAIEITVNLTATPTTANSILNFCGADNTTLADLSITATNGGDLIWYDSATNGTIITDNLILTTGNYYVSEKVGDCESERLALNINVTTPITPTYSGETVICVAQGSMVSNLESLISSTNPYILVWFDSDNNIITTDTLLVQNEIYSVRSTFENTGCYSDAIDITVNITVSPTATNTDIVFCSSENATIADLDVTATTGGTLIWYNSAIGGETLSDDTSLTNATTYYVVERNGEDCESINRLAINVTIITPPTPFYTGETALCALSELTIANLEEQEIEDSEPTQLITFDKDLYELVWYDSEDRNNELSTSDELSETITYFVVIRDIVTQCEGDALEINVSLSNCDPNEFAFFIPDGFSPNNDRTNETYFIPNIQYFYPNYDYEIFNRYGQSLFKGDINNPSWDGTNNGSNTETTTGVYFYILNYNNNELKPEQGRLYLSK